MDDVFSSELEELFKELEKGKDKEKIIKALMANNHEEAAILFKYSMLSSKEYEEIEIGLILEQRKKMNDWSSGKDLAEKAKDILKQTKKGQ